MLSVGMLLVTLPNYLTRALQEARSVQGLHSACSTNRSGLLSTMGLWQSLVRVPHCCLVTSLETAGLPHSPL